MLLELFLPNRCLKCDTIIHKTELVCAICFDAINFTHFEFNKENALHQRAKLLFPIENAFALMHFEEDGLSRKIIHHLKYGNREIIGKIVAHWIVEKNDVDNINFDLIVSVPLHPKKQKKRGYNQLHLFGDTLSKAWGIPINHNLLKRNFHNTSQARKNKTHRTETESLFSIQENPEGKHILLIDDVYTTGNTITSIAWEILEYPDTKVSILMMAID